jgi:hypothetical protein
MRLQRLLDAPRKTLIDEALLMTAIAEEKVPAAFRFLELEVLVFVERELEVLVLVERELEVLVIVELEVHVFYP